MQKPNRGWLALATAAAMVLVPGCGSDNNVADVPVDQAVEAGLDATLATTVVPLFAFFGAMGELLAPPRAQGASRGGVFACPDTSDWCSSGTVTCAVNGAALAFDWDECVVDTGDEPILVHGDLGAVPSDPIELTLTSLFIDDNPAITGTAMIDTGACDYFVDIQTAGAAVSGLVTSCDADPYPTGDSLIIAFDDYLVTVVFDGTHVAHATATLGGSPVADCTIDLDTDPLTSSCDAS